MTLAVASFFLLMSVVQGAEPKGKASVTASAEVPNKVAIIGSINKPGEYLLVEGLTAGKVLAAAGGLTETVLNSGNQVTIRLLRMREGKTSVCIASDDTRLAPGDLLTVDDFRRGNQPPCRAD